MDIMRYSAGVQCVDQNRAKWEVMTMPGTIEQLTHDALELSDLDRAQLAKTLLGSLEPDAEDGVQEAWDTEVAQRLERLRRGAAQGRPADEVFRDIRARHQS